MTDLFGGKPAIKALSIWQPWASLIAAGVKLHETRHWSTDYRGPLAIHAAKRMDLAGAPDQLCAAVFGADWIKTLPLGAVVAVADLAACQRAQHVADHLTAADRIAGNFAHGRFAWRLDRVRQLDNPILALGRQNLFNWEPPEDVEQRLGPAKDHGAACRLHGWA